MKPIEKPNNRNAGLTAVLLLLFAGFVCTSCSTEELNIKLEVENQSPQVLLGMNKLKEPGVAGIVKIVDNRPDPFQLQVENSKTTVTGGDATGLMYGLFDIKEQLESGINLYTFISWTR